MSFLAASVACAKGTSGFRTTSGNSQNSDSAGSQGPTAPPAVGPTQPQPPSGDQAPPTTAIVDDDSIVLDAVGEAFQQSIASSLQSSKYMEQNCTPVTTWQDWQNFPMKMCSYKTEGQSTQVLMLNPGPRRLTQWIQDACNSHSTDVANCMKKTYSQVLDQTGGQFAVAGTIVEDMDGNGKGNAYAFRNGVTVEIAAFPTGTEQPLTASQTSSAFTQSPILTYTYARPISLTRETLSAYAKAQKLNLPDLGSSQQRLNIYNEVIRDLYQSAWSSAKNHIISAWVAAQNF